MWIYPFCFRLNCGSRKGLRPNCASQTHLNRLYVFVETLSTISRFNVQWNFANKKNKINFELCIFVCPWFPASRYELCKFLCLVVTYCLGSCLCPGCYQNCSAAWGDWSWDWRHCHLREAWNSKDSDGSWIACYASTHRSGCWLHSKCWP